MRSSDADVAAAIAAKEKSVRTTVELMRTPVALPSTAVATDETAGTLPSVVKLAASALEARDSSVSLFMKSSEVQLYLKIKKRVAFK